MFDRPRRNGSPSDRRSATRHQSGDVSGSLGWWQDSEFRTCKCVLLNVGSGGAAVLSAEEPPPDRPVWISLDGSEPTGWVEACLVGADRERRRSYRVRIKFPEGCLYDFFKAAVDGCAMLTRPQPDQGPFDSQYWR